MAEERGAPAGRSRPASWTKLFGTFLVALDPFKLLVAAAGILATALGWWLLSVIFYSAWTEPKRSDFETRANKRQSDFADEAERNAWIDREHARSLDSWALMHELAGPTDRGNETYAKYYQERHPDPATRNRHLAEGKGGKYRTMPWAENRGPNPYLSVRTMIGGTGSDRRQVLGQFATYQLPNLIEPLLKFLTPVYYLTDSRASFWVYVYLLLLIVWLLVVWAFFGGVITRMAVLQLTGKEGGGLRESIAYVRRRYLSPETARAMAIEIANATFAARQRSIWGEGSSAVASDSTHFGAWDQNIFTEWHSRYGGRGVLIYSLGDLALPGSRGAGHAAVCNQRLRRFNLVRLR